MAGHSSRVRALRLMIAYAAVAGYLATRCCCSGAHPKDWKAAKDSAETAFFAEFDLPKATETAVHILDDDASMHKNAESDQQDATQLTLLDELFRGTWGAFIVKDTLGQSAEWAPNADSAELSSAGADELAAEDSGRDLDHQALGDARLVPDDLSSEEVTAATGDWPTGDVAAADLADAEVPVENAPSPPEHGGSSIKIGHRGKDNIRSHWRRGHDQAASRHRAADAESVAAETAADRRTAAEGSRLSPQRGRHVVTFRFSGPPDAVVASVTPGRGHGADVKSVSDAGRSVAAATTDETPAHRLPSDGLGHWGRFLPSEVASQQQLRRAPADGDSNHNTRVAAAEPGHTDRIRRPPLTPEQHQPSIVIGGGRDDEGRHDELRTSGFPQAVRPHPSAATAPHQPRAALAIAAPTLQRTPSEGKPDSSALADSEAGRAHPITPAVEASHSVDRDGRRRFASGSDRPLYTAATKAIDNGDGHSNGGHVPNSGGGRRVAAAAPAEAHAAPWPALGAPLARRQRLPHLHRQRELGAASSERGIDGEGSSSWGFFSNQQQQVAAERNTTTVDREVHSRVVASAPSRGERRPRPRPTVEGRFVV